MHSGKRVKVSKFLVSLLAVWLAGWALGEVAYGNPVLNNVAAGNVSIQQTPQSTVVNQASQKAIINWKSFNIGAQESTHFQQPNGGVALNRISPTQGASQIYGRLTATGQIILINSAGIFFGPTAYVNVGGIIVSTANISDQNFLNGNYHFDSVSGNSGSIINQGQIIAASHGLVALIGSAVANDGTIQANLGSVVLASGSSFTISFAGNDMINFSVDSKSLGSNLPNAVRNTGSIIADGGKVIVTAQMASGVLDNVINMSGVVQARSIASQNGEIIISGDKDAGVVTIAGKLDASGKGIGEKGGTVSVTGYNILLDSPTLIDVSGNIGGGNIFVGGNAHGAGPLANANATVMASGATLLANAVVSGNGGNVVLWSDNYTNASGYINAQGGNAGGNGGFVETSSHGVLDVNSVQVNTNAANGQMGMWLLDPEDVYITTSATSAGTFDGGNPNIFTPSGDNSNILNTTIQANLALSNVTITTGSAGAQNGDIYVNAPITWSSANTLFLNAAHNIYLNANITATNGQLNLSAINNPQSITSGSAASPSATGVLANIQVNKFVLVQGQWYQVNTTLPTFIATGGMSFTPSVSFFFQAAGGDGSSGNPYLIANISSLQAIAGNSSLLSSYFQLTRSLDASNSVNWNNGAGFTPIGTSAAPFTGSLDGAGYNISGLVINQPTANNLGLFSYIGVGGAVSNLNITGTVNGLANVGILVANNSGTLTNVHTGGSVTGIANVGGIAGNNIGVIAQSSNSAAVTVNAGGPFFDPVYGFTTDTPYNAGGIAGYNFGHISQSYNNGLITANNGAGLAFIAVGGLVGTNYSSSALIENSYNSGVIISSGGSVGGIVGYNDQGVLQNVYNVGPITGQDYVGGIVGFMADGTLLNAYNEGLVTATGSAGGGLVGANIGAIVNSFFDIDRSGQSNAVGADFGGSTTNVYGDSTANLADENVYLTVADGGYGLVNVSWDFTSIWTLGESVHLKISSGSPFDSIQFLPVAGDGSSGNPYQIADIGSLQAIVNNASLLSSYFVLTQNLDAGITALWNGGNGFSPIGTLAQPFTGSFDGAGFDILALTINQPSGNNVALFAYVGSGAVIANLGIDGNVTGNFNVAMLAAYNAGTITNVHTSGSVTGIANVGGIAANNEGTITQSSNSAAVTVNAGAPFFDTNYGFWTDTPYNVGGIVAYNFGNINQSYNNGLITANNGAGLAFIGIGGLVGTNYSSSALIENSYNSGVIISSGGSVGGIVGYNDQGILQNVYNVGPVTGQDYVGGIVGFIADGTLLNTYNEGLVTATGSAGGGLVGANIGAIVNSFFDIDRSGQSNAVGADFGGSTTNVYGDSTANLADENVYLTVADGGYGLVSVSWDLTTIWSVPSGQSVQLQLAPIPLVSNVAQASFIRAKGGNGSAGTPFQLADIYGLTGISFSPATLAYHYILSNNINAIVTATWNAGAGATPIGTLLQPFSGTLNGAGYTISGFTINQPLGSQLALFGYIDANAAISNINISGTVIGQDNLALLVANNGGTITNASSSGSVTGIAVVGGLVANNLVSGSIVGSHNNASVIGNPGATYIDVNIGARATPFVLGGLSAYNYGSISGSYNSGSVTGNFNGNLGIRMGGLVGINYTNATIENSYNSGTVTSGGNSVGGIAGYNNGFIQNVYNVGPITGAAFVGGIVGLNVAGSVNNTYSAGSVTGVQSVGGIIGSNSVGASVYNSFWDTDTTGQVNGIGVVNDGGPSTQQNIVGGCLTGVCTNGGTANLSNVNTFLNIGWNLSTVWDMDASVPIYPILQAIPAVILPTNTGARIISGTTSASQGIPVYLVMNGVLIDTTSTDSSGHFSFSEANGVIATGNNILIYLGGVSGFGNIVFRAPSRGQNVTGLSVLTNTVSVLGYNATNNILGAASGSLADIGTKILYSLSGNNLTLLSGVSLNIGAGTQYTINGNITTSGAGSLSVNGPITLSANTILTTSNSAVTIGKININGANTLTINAGSGNISFAGDLGAVTAFTSVTLNGTLTLLGNNNLSITTTSDINLNGGVNWLGTGMLTLTAGRNIYFNGTVNGPNGSLTLSAINSANSINSGSFSVPSTTGITANFTVKNFKLLQGQWTQVNAVLPLFNVQNFQLNSGYFSTLTFIRALSGNGSSGSPYALTDIYGVQGIDSNSTTLGYSYVLANNIDASTTVFWDNLSALPHSVGFSPIGLGNVLQDPNGNRALVMFTGSFNGNNFQINNLYISIYLAMIDFGIQRVSETYALFAKTSQTASISNIGVSGTLTVQDIIDQSSVPSALLVGTNGGIISNAFTSGSVFGDMVGGLVGYNYGFVVNSYNTASVAGGARVGGIAAYNYGTISGSHNSGALTTSLVHSRQEYSGGIQAYAGGIAGVNALFDRSTNYVVDSVYTPYIINSYNTGSISGALAVGGIAGNNQGVITGSYNSGTIIGSETTSVNVGGIVGFNDGPLSMLHDSYNTGSVSGMTNVGGVVGLNSGTTYNVYNVGVVSGSQNVGGLAGSNSKIIFNSFWNTDISLQSASIGLVNALGSSSTQSNLIGGCLNGLCTNGGTANLSNKNSYLASIDGGLGLVTQSWDFTGTWGIGLSTPFLWFLTPNSIVNNGTRVISGTSAATPNTLVNLVNNGVIIDTTLIDANGNFAFAAAQGAISDGSNLLIYFGNGSLLGNIVVTAPTLGGSLTGLSFVANTVQVGSNNTVSVLSNSALGSASGSLADIGTKILYSLSGSNLTLLTNINLAVSALTQYTLDGNITAGGTGKLSFNGPVVLSQNSALTTNNQNISFGSTVDGLRSLTLTAGTGLINVANNIGVITPLNNITFNSIISLVGNNSSEIRSMQAISISGANWTGTGTLTLKFLQRLFINGDINGVNGTLVLGGGDFAYPITSGSVASPSATGITANINVNNFLLQSGNWTQVNSSLPTFNVINNFQIGFAYVPSFATPTVFIRATGGNGSSISPYSLVDIYGLQGIGSNLSSTLGYSYILANDIDASRTQNWNFGVGFVPLGAVLSGTAVIVKSNQFVTFPNSFSLTNNADYFFTGNLNGNNKQISNLYINYSNVFDGLYALSYNAAGLFAVLAKTANVSNLSISGTFNGGVWAFGAIAGINHGTITNVHNIGGSVTGTSMVGGLVGNSDGSIINSSNNAAVSGLTMVGGLVGLNNGAITNSINNGNVTGLGLASSYVGGLIGQNLNTLSNSTITYSYNTGAIKGESYVGGLIGENQGNIYYSYNTGNVTGTNTGATVLGGLTGSNTESGVILNAYNTGAVITGSILGGVAGANYGLVYDVYSSGVVSGSATTGGLLGQNYYTGQINNSFWDTTASGQASPIGAANVGGTSIQSNNRGGCLSGSCTNGGTVNLSDAATYIAAGWDLGATWTINSGVSYPTFLASGSPPNTSSRIISGTSSASVGTIVNLVVNGVIIDSTTTAADGSFTFSEANGVVPDNSSILIYLASGSVLGNSVLFAPVNGYNIFGISIIANTLNIGTTSQLSQFSNSILGLTAGSLADIGTKILYSLSSNNLTLLSNTNFVTTLLTTYTLAGNLTTSGTGSLTFNGPVILSANATLATANRPITFNSTLDGTTSVSTALTVNAGTSIINFASNVGSRVALSSVTLVSDLSLVQNRNVTIIAAGDITIKGANWLGAGTLTLNNVFSAMGNIYLNGNINAPNGTLTLFPSIGIGSGGSLAYVSANINVKNFNLLNGFWTQMNAVLPQFNVSNDFRLGGAFFRGLGGDGSLANPYLLTDIYGVQGLAANSAGEYYQLANNIDASQTQNWNDGAGFDRIFLSASLDGNNFNISNLYIFATPSPLLGGLGLFSRIMSSGSVSNLSLSGTFIVDDQLPVYAGFLAGINDGVITNVHVSGSVNGGVGSALGGLVGWNTGSIVNSDNSASVSGSSRVGGIAGTNSGIISHSYNAGSITGSDTSVGGVAGFNLTGGSISDSYNTGIIRGNTDVGGVVGTNSLGTTLTRAYNVGAVYGVLEVGGLAGYNGGTVTNSYNAGSVMGLGSTATKVGGLVGLNNNVLYDAYNVGTVIAADRVGGVAGYNEGSIYNTYGGGLVVGTSNVGGVIGDNSNGVSVTNNFWDTDLSGQAAGVGLSNLSNPTTAANVKGGCLSGVCTNGGTANLSSASTFTAAGWNFSSVWGIVPGASEPYLLSFFSSTPRVIAGIAPVGSNIQVNLVYGGAVIGTTQTAANGYFSFMLPNGTIADGSNLLVYLANGSVVGNVFATAPILGGSLAGGASLSILANTLQVGMNFGSSFISNSALGLVSGSLSDIGTKILYSLSGSNLSLNNNINLLVGNGVVYTLDGNITTSGTGSITFNGAVHLNSNAVLTTNNSNVTFNSVVDSADTTPYSLTVNAGSAVINANSDFGRYHALNSITLNSILNLTGNNSATLNATNNITITGATWTGTGTLSLLAGKNIYINGAISGVNGSLILSAVNAANSITSGSISSPSAVGVAANVSVANFNMLSGRWNQVNSVLPTLSVTGNFQLNSGLALNVENIPPSPVEFIRAIGGNGSSANPYLLTDIFGVQGIGSDAATLGYSYRLANNVNAAVTSNWNQNQGFLPIGIATVPFTGSLNGNSFTISNLFISRGATNNVALFSFTSATASISNLTLTGSVTGSFTVAGLVANNSGAISNVHNGINVVGSPTLSGGGNIVAGLVAYNKAGGVITNSDNTGNVTGLQNVAGLVSRNEGTISNVFNSGTITGTGISDTIAGLVANNSISSGVNSGSITNAYNTGAVSGLTNVGGLVGNNYGSITSTYNAGSVSGLGLNSSNIGGLVAFNQSGGIILNSYNNNVVSGQANVGGLVGVNAGKITSSYNTSAGIVSGFSNTSNVLAGLVGFNMNGGLISGSYNVAAVSGYARVAGLVGNNNGLVVGSYNTGAVSGVTSTASMIAGLVAENQSNGVINNSYNTGAVSGVLNIAGLTATNNGVILYAYNAGTVTASNVSASGAGGLVNLNHGLIANSYNAGSVTSLGANAGGLVATNASDGVIINAYNVSAVAAASGVGGLVDQNAGYIASTYSAGAVSGLNMGGLIGNNTGIVVDSFWDTQTSGTSTGIAAGTNAGATGKTTAQMKTQSTYITGGSNWNFVSNWTINSGVSYPTLLSASSASRLIIGTAIPNQTVGLIANGALIGQMATLGNSSYYVFSVNSSLVPDAASLLVYLTGNSNKANSVTTAPQGNLSIYGLNLTLNTLSVVDNGNLDFTYAVLYPNLHNANFTVINNSNLVNALGGLTGSDFLYTASGLNINVKNNTNFVTAPNVFYQLTGDVSTTNANITLNGMTQVGGNVTLRTISSGNMTQNNMIVWPVGSYATLNLVSANNIYLGSHVLGAALDLTTFNQVSFGSLNLTAANTNQSITTGSASDSSIQVQNFNLLQGKWYQDQTGLNDGHFAQFNVGQPYEQTQNEPIFTVYGNFQINSGVMPSTVAEFQRFFVLTSQHYLYDWYGLQGIGSNANTLAGTYYLYSTNQLGTNVITAFWNNGQGFVPIGNAATPFTGSLYGSHLGQPAGLTINRPTATNVGLFGVTGPTALISGVYVREASILGDTNVGGLVGFNQGAIDNSSVFASFIIGNNNVGAITGYNSGSISNTAVQQDRIMGSQYVGGISGINSGVIDKVLVATYLGGTTTNIGGITGYNSGLILNSFWDTDVTGQTKATGVNVGTLDHVTGACYLGNCINGGTANLSMQRTYLSLADGGLGLVTSSWDFTNTWGILPGDTAQGFSYAYLMSQFDFSHVHTPRVFAGYTNPAASNEVVVQANGLFNNGLYSWININYTITGADGSFYIINPFGVITNSTLITLNVVGGVTGGAVSFLAPEAHSPSGSLASVPLSTYFQGGVPTSFAAFTPLQIQALFANVPLAVILAAQNSPNASWFNIFRSVSLASYQYLASVSRQFYARYLDVVNTATYFNQYTLWDVQSETGYDGEWLNDFLTDLANFNQSTDQSQYDRYELEPIRPLHCGKAM